jgi:DNA-binding Lrp family transcriptional regulator
MRDVAANVGITERAVQKIVGDLEDAGILCANAAVAAIRTGWT